MLRINVLGKSLTYFKKANNNYKMNVFEGYSSISTTIYKLIIGCCCFSLISCSAVKLSNSSQNYQASKIIDLLRTAHESEIDSLIFEYSEDEKWALFEELLVDPASDISQARLVSLFDDGCRTARTIYGRVELRRNIINSNNLQSSNITCLKYEDKSNQSCNLWRIGSVNAPLITQVCSTDAGPMEVYPPEYKNFDRKKITATCAIKARARALRVTCEPNF